MPFLNKAQKKSYSLLPKVDFILKEAEITFLIENEIYSKKLVLKCINSLLNSYRAEIENNNFNFNFNLFIKELKEQLGNFKNNNFKKVINASGVLIHTNLGRLPLAKKAYLAVEEVAKNYSNLEYSFNLEKRETRLRHVNNLLKSLTGAQEALVVNNNAAALLLIGATFAKDKEVIISRGEMVEIGDSFRLSDILNSAGVILKEVGSTNKTKIFDYEEATTLNTALYLQVNRSNFQIKGFTQEVQAEDLVKLAKKNNVISVYDQGSGLIIKDENLSFLAEEKTVRQLVNIGFNLICFSGDKILGGPQVGIIVGNKKLIKILQNNHMYRALRVDKLSLAALEATLRLYYSTKVYSKIPILKYLTIPLNQLKEKTELVAEKLNEIFANIFEIKVVESLAVLGGGVYLSEELKSYALQFFSSDEKKIINFNKALKALETPILARLNSGKLFLDLRTLSDDDIIVLINACKHLRQKMYV